jgi:hypothetical protein
MAIVGRIEGERAPFNSVSEDVAAVGGFEKEFLFEGTATSFALVGGGNHYPADGRWSAEPASRAAFRSRMLVERPGEPADFNGTVVVVWNNVSRTHDYFMDPERAAQLVDDGFALVGVTTQIVAVDGAPPFDLPESYRGERPEPAKGLREEDPQRYGTLAHPGDAYCYDIFTQAGELVGPDRPRDLDPLDGLDVRHLVASGPSQSANRLAAYYNGVQPKASVHDAFLLVVYAGCPCALDPATAPESLPQIPTNASVSLLEWRTHLLRDDLGVPVLVLNSEFEAEQCFPNVQPDSATIRNWEIAGTAHVSVRRPVDFPPTPGINRVSVWPIGRAAYHALHAWLEGDGPPARQPRLEKVGDPPVLPRDEHGNALGGIRWPDLEAPLGTHIGECSPTGFANLNGSTSMFDADTVRALYGDKETWVKRYSKAVDDLVASGVVLPDDAERMKELALAQDIGI